MPSIQDPWIVVPSYWTHPTTAPGDEPTVFDHPTPLDEGGTLRRTLETFRVIDGEFNVLVVAACAHPSLGGATREHVGEIIKPLAADMPLYLAGPGDVDRLNAQLPEPILSLDSYGNIRNVQLFVPYAAGADVEIGIDDDELIEDPAYLDKVLEFLGREHHGEFVGGMAGPYYDADGEYQLAGADDLAGHANIFIKKNYFMNEALKQAIGRPCPEKIVKSNVAFGGNMCMARTTIAQACHDPYIPRGEDYDYVINAAMAGVFFFTRPDMSIVHLPPDATGSQAADKISKMIADIRRFIYMREKHNYHRAHFPGEAFPLDYLLPYPGAYLDESVDLCEQGIAAMDELYPEYRETHSPEALVKEATETAKLKAEEFFAYREKWTRTLTGLDMMTDEMEALAL
jgi:hypothetical protein